MKWISIKDKLPINGKYYLICSNNGWIGFQKYENDAWCHTGYPDVVCNDIIYDVANKDIEYYIAIEDISLPNQPERSKREDSRECCKLLTTLKYIFQDDRPLIDVRKYVNDLIKDCEMRCSEHCGNTVRDK